MKARTLRMWEAAYHANGPPRSARRAVISAGTRERALPNLAALLRRAHHRRPGLARKCFRKRLEVRERADHAELLHRIVIALDHHELRLGAGFAPPGTDPH